MNFTRCLVVASSLLIAFAAQARAESLQVPTFGTISIYRPDATPKRVVLFLSGDGGWHLGVVSMAERLRGLGALVVGIDIRTFLQSLERSKNCAYPAGALEELARAIEIRYGFSEYRRPIVAGYSSGATLVYAVLAAAPPETFAGGISLGFCPDLEIGRELCPMRQLKATPRAKGKGYDLAPARLAVPWMVLQGEIDKVCDPATTRAFVAATGSGRVFMLPKVGHGYAIWGNWGEQFVEAYRAIPEPDDPPSQRAVASRASDLPLIEVPSRTAASRDAMALLVTGDGGWADLDRSVADGLAAAGIPTVALNSLRYFWTRRQPDEAAADLARIIDSYSAAWNKREVILIGYSFGADVLPLLTNRMNANARSRVRKIVLLGLSESAALEFHVSDWFASSRETGYPTLPELERLDVPVLCVRGAGEDDSPCARVKNPHVRAVVVGTGHHFSGDYPRLIRLILGE